MDNVETRTETVHEIAFTEDGSRETETTTTTLPEVRHCTCEECLQWDEDVTRELATLRERVTTLETQRSEETPAPGPTETVVETTPEVAAESKPKEQADAPAPAPRRSPRGAGIFW